MPLPPSLFINSSVGISPQPHTFYNVQILPSKRNVPTVSEDTIAGAEDENTPVSRADELSRRLREELTTLFTKHTIGLSPECQYVPISKLDELLMNDDKIHDALGGGDDRQLAMFIFQHAKSTFAILILVFKDWSLRQRAMQVFQYKAFTDETLRMMSTPLDPLRGLLKLCNQHTCAEMHCHHYFPNDIWEQFDLEGFKLHRRKFLVHTLDHTSFLSVIDILQPLPFVRRLTRDEMNNGNFSEVACVEVVASKQTKMSYQGDHIVVALKTLKKIKEKGYEIEKEWRREAEAYKQLNDSSRHIIQGIAAVRQKAADSKNDEFHLILEWADGGSLHNFCQQHSKPQLLDGSNSNIETSRKRVKEVLEQFCGLAEALESMHTTSGFDQQGSRRQSVDQSLGRSILSASSDNEIPSIAFEGVHVPRIYLPESAEREISSQIDENSDLNVFVSPPDSVVLDLPPGSKNVRRGSNKSSINWRHGDIKPENILRFTEGKENAWIGLLKLADLGRAQQHELKTALRETKEKEPWRTRWYEPPDLAEEVHKKAQEKISRLFDIWSIGCVIFETVRWLLYGNDSITQYLLANDLKPEENNATPYWRKMDHGRYGVSSAANTWMRHILQKDPERDGAIGDIIKLVRDKLLVVTLPQDSEKVTEGCRTNATDLRNQLEHIKARGLTDETYLFSGLDRSKVTYPPADIGASQQVTTARDSGSRLSPLDAARRDHKSGRSRATTIAQQRVYTKMLDERWRILDDTKFAQSILGSQPGMLDDDDDDDDEDLCEACKELDILSAEISFRAQMLREETCELCTVVGKSVEGLNIGEGESVVLERAMDCLVLQNTQEKVLRLCRIKNGYEQELSLGAPSLIDPKTRSDYFNLPLAWLEDCDRNHRTTCDLDETGTQHRDLRLPKRLIYLRKNGKQKLVDSDTLKSDSSKIRYIAFSHKWGKMPKIAMTTMENLHDRGKKIAIGELTASFQDAIKVTRALKYDYLWIDSICIAQGPDGDFAEQADTMQIIFNNAYCVIAAPSAESSTDGFLHERELELCKIDNIYVSSVTNDFERDVLQSPLSRQGWVLQERALARRTIFFTKTQMYWECGHGIRCETLTKLKNDDAAFLGDPRFPEYTISATSTAGEQIHHFTKLFQQYSELEFSHPQDRPIAIDSLMLRLTAAFKTRSLAGLFQTFWGRCLLWQRPHEPKSKPLTRISFDETTKKAPPSWSWMAVQGAISFLEPGGGEVEWNTYHLKLPFAGDHQISWLKTSNSRQSNAIRAQAFHIIMPEGLLEATAYLNWDGVQAVQGAKCVIVGSEKHHAQEPGKRRIFVLLVARVVKAVGTEVYERVGVGHLPKWCINIAEPIFVSIE